MTLATDVQLAGDVLVERYRYPPGPADAMPMHVHADSWQWCLYVGGPVADPAGRAIAVAVGFADHPHFARRFRQWVGLPPSRYAKNVQDVARRVRLDAAP